MAQVRTAVRAAGLPLLAVNEREQVGDGFAERLTAACARAFALGHERLIVVGGDSIDLCGDDLLRAHEALDRGDEVIGRDHRGGVYLIGLHRSRFRENAFRALPWQTDRLADALADLLHGPEELARRHDLNVAADLVDVRARLRGRAAWSFLFEADAAAAVVVRAVGGSEQAAVSGVPSRGPPAVAA